MYAKVNSDSRSDTKSLEIVVRDPLTVTAAEPFVGRRALGEVTVPFDSTLESSGGTGTYTWALAGGTLPPGLSFANGAITGTPRTAGTFPFVVAVTDSEGRKANDSVRISIASRFTVKTAVLRIAKVGKFYGAKLKTSGGVRPTSWRIARGRLPKGIRFDRTLGALSGTPDKAGRYRLVFVATDALQIVAKKTLALNVVG